MKRFVMMVSAVLLVSALAAEEKPNVEPGLWQYTSVTRVDGGAMQIPEQEHTQTECLTAEDLEEPDFLVKQGEGCDFYDQKISRDSMSFTMVCVDMESGMSMNMDSELSFHGDRMEGTMTGDLDSPMGQLTMNIDVTGERLDDC